MIKKAPSKIKPAVKSGKGKREPVRVSAKPKPQPARATAVKHAPVKTKVELRKPELKKPLPKNFKPESKPISKPIPKTMPMPKMLGKEAPKFAPKPQDQKSAKAEPAKAGVPKLAMPIDPKAKLGLKVDPKALKKNGAATPEGAPPGTPRPSIVEFVTPRSRPCDVLHAAIICSL